MIQENILPFIFTALSSVCIVALAILLGWLFIWRAFLSKFKLVREILGQNNTDVVNPENREKTPRVRKIRKD